jgi:trimethylamine--corrinoid protein Co-methyltransferase
MGILVAALSGINLSRGPGMMAFANCQSPEKLVIDNEICGMAQRFVRGVDCSPETIALDVIKAAGRDAKGYLTSSHTLEWFRKELIFPGKIIHRWTPGGKEKEASAWDRARSEVEARLDNFVPAHLPEERTREIMRIMKSYARSKGVDCLPRVNSRWIG